MEALRKFRLYFSNLGSMFVLLWVMMFMVCFADSLCGPVIPYLVREFLLDEAAVVAMIGLLSSVFNLVKTIANVPGGILGDKMNRSMIVLISLLLLPTSYLLLFLAEQSYWILCSYILLGIFWGLSMPSLSAIIADIIPENIRGTAFAIFNLSWITSQTVAPVLGGFLADNFFIRFPFISALLLSIAVISLYLSSIGKVKAAALPVRLKREIGRQKGTISTEHLRLNILLLCCMRFFSGVGNGILMPITTAFLMYTLNTSPTEMGLAFSVGWGVATALAQVPGGKAADKLGPKVVILLSTLVATPLLLLLPFSVNVFQFMLFMGLICFIGNLSSPAFSAWIANLIGTERRGKGYGFTSAASGAGAIIGPIIGSLTWTLFEPNHLLPFAFALIPFLLMLPFVIILKSKV
ncbi:MAG: MFS transporter [Candidatus Bathyarchaeia archaeon]